MKLHLSLIAALVVVALPMAASAAPVDATVKSVSGSVQSAPPGSTTFAPLSAGTKLPSGTTIKTGPDSEAIIVTTPGTAIRVDESTSLTISDMAFAKDQNNVAQRKATVNLTSGTVSSLIDHSTPDVTDFVVRTPQGSAAARGTFYGVTVKDGHTYLKVQEGKVGVAAKEDKKKDGAAPAAVPAGAQPPLPASGSSNKPAV